MTSPRNYAEALRELDDAERALIEAQTVLIESARARGASDATLEYLREMFRRANGRLLH